MSRPYYHNENSVRGLKLKLHFKIMALDNHKSLLKVLDLINSEIFKQEADKEVTEHYQGRRQDHEKTTQVKLW